MGTDNTACNLQFNCSILCGIRQETSAFHSCTQIRSIKSKDTRKFSWNQTICIWIISFQEAGVEADIFASEKNLIVSKENLYRFNFIGKNSRKFPQRATWNDYVKIISVFLQSNFLLTHSVGVCRNCFQRTVICQNKVNTSQNWTAFLNTGCKGCFVNDILENFCFKDQGIASRNFLDSWILVSVFSFQGNL